MSNLFNPSILAAAAAAPAPVLIPTVSDWVARSASLTPQAEVTVEGMVRPFLAHQAAAYEYASWFIANRGWAVIADDMGLGKTQVMQALIAANGGRAIVIAPPVTLGGWRSDLAAAFPHLRFHHCHGRKPDFANLPEADIYFVSDDTLTMRAWLTDPAVDGKGHKTLVANAFARSARMLVRDEIHRDKGIAGKAKAGSRADVMLRVSRDLRAMGTPIVAATGTLTSNRPVEAFVPLQIVGGESLVLAVTPGAHKASGFLWRYCNPVQQYVPGRGKVTVFTGVDTRNVVKLNELLREHGYVRREKTDLAGMLPNAGWIVRPIALNGVLARYNRVEEDVLSLVREEKGPEAFMRAARAERLRQIMMLWEEAGAAKGQAVMDYVSDLTDQGRSVVVFYAHNRALEAMLKHTKGVSYTILQGGMTPEARVATVEEFQAGEVQICFAQIEAAGIGVTLTAAADAVFCQTGWSAGGLKQCADRIYRVDNISRDRAANGESVTWHVLQAAHGDGAPTFDMAMWNALAKKAQVCDAINAGKPVTMSDENVILAALQEWYPQASARYAS